MPSWVSSQISSWMSPRMSSWMSFWILAHQIWETAQSPKSGLGCENELVWTENKIPFALCSEFQNSYLTPRNHTCINLARYFGQFEKNLGFSYDPESQPGQTKPHHSQTRHFRPFDPFLVQKYQQVNIFDLRTYIYPLNRWGVLSWKILVSPFWKDKGQRRVKTKLLWSF